MHSAILFSLVTFCGGMISLALKDPLFMEWSKAMGLLAIAAAIYRRG